MGWAQDQAAESLTRPSSLYTYLLSQQPPVPLSLGLPSPPLFRKVQLALGVRHDRLFHQHHLFHWYHPCLAAALRKESHCRGRDCWQSVMQVLLWTQRSSVPGKHQWLPEKKIIICRHMLTCIYHYVTTFEQLLLMWCLWMVNYYHCVATLE